MTDTIHEREVFFSIIMMITEYKNCGEFIINERKIQQVPAKSGRQCSDWSFLLKKTWKSLWWKDKMMKWAIATDLASSLVNNTSIPFLKSKPVMSYALCGLIVQPQLLLSKLAIIFRTCYNARSVTTLTNIWKQRLRGVQCYGYIVLQTQSASCFANMGFSVHLPCTESSWYLWTRGFAKSFLCTKYQICYQFHVNTKSPFKWYFSIQQQSREW